MSQQASLEVIEGKRVAEKRIPPKIYHAQAHVQRSMEVIGHLLHLITAKRVLSD
jgi:hypothetical protein